MKSIGASGAELELELEPWMAEPLLLRDDDICVGFAPSIKSVIALRERRGREGERGGGRERGGGIERERKRERERRERERERGRERGVVFV